MEYKFLDHTADVKFQAFGNTLEEAFVSSFYALKETICGKIEVKKHIKKELLIEGTDISNVLYKFLEEFLFLLDSEGFLVSEIEKIDLNEKENKLKVIVLGDKSENYTFTNDVKAITYNNMSIEFDDQTKKYVLQVVLDV
jgi:SHS2 domain-containing protein